ncbi:MAG: DUF11 domain-containing protein [Azoarcus sp.]|jgi:hypothetical protein|nr:DUF11 domain-containing protein [Azoarcus sp.]
MNRGKLRFRRRAAALLCGLLCMVSALPESAVAAAPEVQYIRVTPVQPPPRPPLTVGMNGVTATWEVKFRQPVKGVSAKAFRLVSTGIGAPGASIVSVSGAGDTYYVAANIPSGSIAPDKLASLRLEFVDDGSVQAEAGGQIRPRSSVGAFFSETYTLQGTVCGAPDALWCDDFERTVSGASKAYLVGNGWVASTGGTCASYAPGGTVQPDQGGCAGIDSDIKPYNNYAYPRANSGRSMFNRWREHTVTSAPIDLSGQPVGATVELSYWLRRGANDFADAPAERNDNMRVEYQGKDGLWQTLALYRGTGGGAVPGEALRAIFQLPEDALWKDFRLRFTQTGGRGPSRRVDASKVNGYDYWFIDDVLLRRSAAPRYAGGFCDNFESPAASLRQWSFGHEDAASGAGSGVRIGEAGITGDIYPTSGSKDHSLFLRWSYAVASTLRIDTRGLTEPIRYVAQRGMRNAPDTINGANVVKTCDQTTAEKGNRFVSEYFGSDQKWHVLQDVDGMPGSNGCGEDLSYVSPPLSLLPDAQHENFRLRFRQISFGPFQSNTLDRYDYWLVDDVCVGRAMDRFPRADLSLTKTREGPLSSGSIAAYVLKAKNNGPDRLRGSLQIEDALPPGMSFYAFHGQGWLCGSNGQHVTCSWSGDLKSGDSAPDLRIYATVPETITGALTNWALVSSGAVEDPLPENNGAYEKAQVEAAYFAFTKGKCEDGQTVDGENSGKACSRYKFGGLAGELKTDIHLTHVDETGRSAVGFPGNASIELEFALRCVDPPGPPAQGTVYATFGGETRSPLNACARSDEAEPHWNTAQPLSVTVAAGEATVNGVYSFSYEDVGRMELLVRVAEKANKKGGSGGFVQKPAALVLKNVSCADGTPNPGATAADGARFCRAGQAFSMTAEARSMQGNGTPNFGHENQGAAIFLEKTLSMPLDGNDPGLVLRGLAGFTNGAATTAVQAWPEVGIIVLRPRLGHETAVGIVLSKDYLGAGDVPEAGLAPVSIGRFYPDHFRTEIGAAGRMACPAGHGCPAGGFFYTGQPFELIVKACAHGDEPCGRRLENYRGDFAARVGLDAWAVRGSTVQAHKNPPDSDINGGRLEPLPGRGLDAAAIPGSEFVDAHGFGGVFSGLFRYVHTLKSRPIEPVDIYIRATENGRDAVSSRLDVSPDDSPEGGIRLARGRLELSSRFVEGKTLEIPVQVQFWHCGDAHCAWTHSATDATRIEPDLMLPDAGARAALSVSLHPAPDGELAKPPRVERFDLSGGMGKIVLEPGEATGSVNVSVNLGQGPEDNACNHAPGFKEGMAAKLPWLRAWHGTCPQAQSGEADPAARASFGVYSGESRKAVHGREVY